MLKVSSLKYNLNSASSAFLQEQLDQHSYRYISSDASNYHISTADMASTTAATTITEVDTKSRPNPPPPSHHHRAGLIAGFITIALLTLAFSFWVIYHFVLPLWKAPYRAADQADLQAVRKWNEDLAEGLRERRANAERVGGISNEQAVGQVPARWAADVEIGAVRDPAHEAVPESWRAEL